MGVSNVNLESCNVIPVSAVPLSPSISQYSPKYHWDLTEDKRKNIYIIKTTLDDHLWLVPSLKSLPPKLAWQKDSFFLWYNAFSHGTMGLWNLLQIFTMQFNSAQCQMPTSSSKFKQTDPYRSPCHMGQAGWNYL